MIKNQKIIGYAQEYCKEMKIPFTAVSELIIEGDNPHGDDRIYLIGSDSIPRLISVLRETKKGFYAVAGMFEGEYSFFNKYYLHKKNRFSEEQFKDLFSECFRRWDKIFKKGE